MRNFLSVKGQNLKKKSCYGKNAVIEQFFKLAGLYSDFFFTDGKVKKCSKFFNHDLFFFIFSTNFSVGYDDIYKLK